MNKHEEKAMEIAGITAERTGVNIHLMNAITQALREAEAEAYERAAKECDKRALKGQNL